jgi:2-polyprenyl-3-methyl-5-hydroxy-6-metoxy-1,4-benzoquinol methylase
VRTAGKTYTNRLVSSQKKRWKSILDVQRPYRWNLRRLNPGKTLDVGCGIGRCLAALPAGSVGTDHNPYSIDLVNRAGLIGFLPDDFQKSDQCTLAGFDTLLIAHVLEHMTIEDGTDLVKKHSPLIRVGGMAILICPQERGFATDPSHVTFLDADALAAILQATGFVVEKNYSFPFPRMIGRIFPYNEFVVVGRKTSLV